VDKVDRLQGFSQKQKIRHQNLWHKRSIIIINSRLTGGYDRNLNTLLYWIKFEQALKQLSTLNLPQRRKGDYPITSKLGLANEKMSVKINE